MKITINRLRKNFEVHTNPEKAKKQKAYLRNQFEFFGINAPEHLMIRRKVFKHYGLPEPDELEKFVRDLWAQPEREFQYFGLDLVEKSIKHVNKDFISVIEFMITNKAWWDTVDMIATHHVAALFRRFPEMIPVYTKKWLNSQNIWLQRTALLFQLKYKDKTDTTLLFDMIRKLAGHKDFFIRKAIGWVLREYSKTAPDAVIQFIDQNQLSPLSKREALKVISKKQ
jgi:3-methyladenine DNA glycosylase AlkD